MTVLLMIYKHIFPELVQYDGYVALADVYFKMGKNKEAYSIASQGLAKYKDSRILRTLANNIYKNKID